eukprot:11214642-Lingulodinium_polyedra.AAC.1
MSWLEARLRLPARCAPIVGLDLNDGLGLRVRDGVQIVDDAPEVGVAEPAMEHFAATKLRSVLATHYM